MPDHRTIGHRKILRMAEKINETSRSLSWTTRPSRLFQDCYKTPGRLRGNWYQGQYWYCPSTSSCCKLWVVLLERIRYSRLHTGFIAFVLPKCTSQWTLVQALDKKDWEKVLWTDEAPFSVNGQCGKMYVRRRTGEELSPQCVTSTVKHGEARFQCRAASLPTESGIFTILFFPIYVFLIKSRMCTCQKWACKKCHIYASLTYGKDVAKCFRAFLPCPLNHLNFFITYILFFAR